MLTTTLAALFSVATLGAAVQSDDTTRATVDPVVERATPADSAERPAGPRRSLAHVAASRETVRARRSTAIGDSAAQRRRAVEHSDWYYRRLTIHKVASFATVPLFAAEYLVGQKLFDEDNPSGNLRSTHQALAGGIGVLFGVNTVTGAWNLWDSRHDSDGRARRITHAALMLVSDAGFVATASLAPEGEDRNEGEREDSDDRDRHRNVAIGSMGLSLVSYLMMYLWK